MKTNISRDWKLKDEVVYGPFPTRRKGNALGINVLALGEKFCSFDCLYCQCGWTRQFDPDKALPEHYLSLEDIQGALSSRFDEVVQNQLQVDALVLSGNGEPTLHPYFDQVVDLLLKARDQYFPHLKVQCLSAGSELHRQEVREGLNRLDKPTFKLDAAVDSLHRLIDRPLVDFDLDCFESQLRRIDRVYLQTCFFDGKISNITDEALEAWFQAVGRIAPREVEIYSIHRQPAAKKLSSVSLEKLSEIADILKHRYGIPSLVV